MSDINLYGGMAKLKENGGDVPAPASSPFELWFGGVVFARWLEAFTPLTPLARFGARDLRAVASFEKNTAILAGISETLVCPVLFTPATPPGVHSQRRTGNEAAFQQ